MAESKLKVSGYDYTPLFSETEPYDQWKSEAIMWTMVTSLAKRKQGMALAHSLPYRRKIRQKVFSELELEELNMEEGLNNL